MNVTCLAVALSCQLASQAAPAPADPPAAAPPAALPAPAIPVTSTPTETSTAVSPLPGVVLTPRVFVRVRGELVGDRTLGLAPVQNLITHRARLGLSATAADRVSAVIDIQDVRVWGSELVPPPPVPQDPTVYGAVAGSLSLHQGYAGLLLSGAEIRAGRQEIALSNERLIGPLDWAQRARAFDAVRVLSRGTSDLTWTTFFAIIRDHEAVSPADPAIEDVVLGAAAAEIKVLPALRIAPTVVGDADLTLGKTRGTAGVRADGSVGGFNYDAELYG